MIHLKNPNRNPIRTQAINRSGQEFDKNLQKKEFLEIVTIVAEINIHT